MRLSWKVGRAVISKSPPERETRAVLIALYLTAGVSHWLMYASVREYELHAVDFAIGIPVLVIFWPIATFFFTAGLIHDTIERLKT